MRMKFSGSQISITKNRVTYNICPDTSSYMCLHFEVYVFDKEYQNSIIKHLRLFFAVNQNPNNKLKNMKYCRGEID